MYADDKVPYPGVPKQDRNAMNSSVLGTRELASTLFERTTLLQSKLERLRDVIVGEHPEALGKNKITGSVNGVNQTLQEAIHTIEHSLEIATMLLGD